MYMYAIRILVGYFQVSMPRGHYPARAMPAARPNFAFSIQSMTNAQLSPVQLANMPNHSAIVTSNFKPNAAGKVVPKSDLPSTPVGTGLNQTKVKGSKATHLSAKPKSDDGKAGVKENGNKVTHLLLVLLFLN